MSTFRMIAPLAVAAAMLAGATAGADAYQCRAKSESTVMVGVNQPTAAALGQAAWSSKVKTKFGLEWSVWSIAANPQQACAPAGGGGSFQCATIAKPCKYVVE